MCNKKCFRTHILVLLVVVLTIILVFIIGVTLTNSINIANIIKLREKVASDSAAASSAIQTRTSLLEQKYTNLQQHHLSRSDINYISASHPKNLKRFSDAQYAAHRKSFNQQRHAHNDNKNRIVIELNLSNLSSYVHEGQVANSMTSAIDDGNVDSISLPATSFLTPHQYLLNDTKSALTSTTATTTTTTTTTATTMPTPSATSLNDAQLLARHPVNTTATASTNIQMQLASEQLSIADHNPGLIDFDKRNHIKKMMEHAWANYKLYAWGKNELKPLSQRPHSGSIFGGHELGATIVDGLDTLYLMGLEKEYKEGRDWIERKLSLDNISADLSVFETNIRFVGGLLTLYSFTGDNLYKEKAQHIADKLLPAFQTPTGIPYALVNTKTGSSKNYGWASGGSSILSEFGTLHLEFAYLSDITGNPLYRERVQAIRQILKEIEKPKGLYPNFLNPKTGKWGQQHMSLGALGDSFYEYLLKSWLQSGQTDDDARTMFDEAMLAIIDKMVRTSPNGLTYVSDMKFDRLEHKMDHLACFSGGLFALGGNTLQNENAQKFMEIGKGITNTCHESYIRTATRLGPEAFRFSDAAEARALKSQEKYYILRPETIESYFVLWRLTHDQKYRDWGWDAVEALEKHCRTPHGYCGIKNVYQEVSQKDDVQQSFFLAETLKYLYLLFSDDSLLPLDEWVFNTEAHPLPIKGASIYYRQAPANSPSNTS